MNRQMPVPFENAQPPLQTWAPVTGRDRGESAPPLRHHLWVLRRHRWKIVAFIVACELATLIVSSRVNPIYESTSVIDVDRQAPSGVIGEQAMRANINDSDN